MRTRKWMKVGRGKGVLLAVSLLAVLLVLIMTAPAFAADRWTDISDAQWLGTYKITADEAATVAEGYPDNTFRPGLALSRGQSAKMIVDGFGLAIITPAAPTFIDVPPTHYYYPWIESGTAIGAIQGYDDNTYRPSISVVRQQFNSILGRILSQMEIQRRGHILGGSGQYATLAAWFAAEGGAILDAFEDLDDVATVHRPGTAYLAFRNVVLGRPVGLLTYLDPAASITRAQAVAMIVRARKVADSFAPAVTYTITASAGANGSIAPSGAVTVAQGANQTFTITPAVGYVVDDVLVDGASVGAVTTYTFTNVTANHTIAASFKTAPKRIFGVVYGLGDTQYLLQGATVTVARVSNGSLIGTATTGSDGSFSISMTGVDLGTQVLVQATCPGYVLVAILGIYDENSEEVNFQRFTSPTTSDRRLKEGSEPAAPPYNGLLPD